jgi:hypothetical protein
MYATEGNTNYWIFQNLLYHQVSRSFKEIHFFLSALHPITHFMIHGSASMWVYLSLFFSYQHQDISEKCSTFEEIFLCLRQQLDEAGQANVNCNPWPGRLENQKVKCVVCAEKS